MRAGGSADREVRVAACLALGTAVLHEEDRAATEHAMRALFAPPHTAYLEQRAMTTEGWRWLATKAPAGAHPVHAFHVFDVFPRLTLRLVWHAPDEEFPPSATLLLPDNIEAFFVAEDIVVLSECLVARLGG